jgi:hypothetical protein
MGNDIIREARELCEKIDATLMARSRTIIPELLDALENAEAKIKDIHHVLDDADQIRSKCTNYAELSVNNGFALGKIAIIIQHDYS